MNHPLYLFLLLLVTGSAIIYLIYGRKIKQFRDYITLNRATGTAPLAISMITYLIAGSMLWFGIGNTAINGISGSITRVMYYSITIFIFSYAVFPRLLTFQNSHTLGGLIKHMYGRLAGTITSLLASMVCCYVIYYQLTTLVTISPIFNNHRNIFLLIVGIAAMVQALWISNNRISTISIIQFVLIVGLLFSLTTIVLYLEEVKAAGGGLQGLLQAIKDNVSIQEDRLLTYKPGCGSILNGLLFPVAFLYPPFLQRILINKDHAQMQNASWGVAIFHICLQGLIIIIGLGATLMHVSQYGNPPANFDAALAALFQHEWVGLLYAYLGLISSIGVISYFLHSLAVELSQNLLKPYSNGKMKNDNSWIKRIIVAAGSLCILIALISKYDYYNFFSPLIMFMPALLAPFMIGAIGRLKNNNTIFIIGIVTFYLTTIVLLWAIRYGHFPIQEGLSLHRQLARTSPIAIFASGLAILTAHNIFYGGFVQREEGLKNRFQKYYKEDSFGTMLSDPLSWAKDKLEKYDNNPTAIGAFLLFTLALPSLVGSNGLPSYIGGILFAIRIGGIALATIMMFHNFFPYALKKLFPLLWFFSLGYCIPFCHGFFILCNPHNYTSIVKLILLLLFLRLITDIRTFLMLIGIGFLSAYICYRNFIPLHMMNFSLQETLNIGEITILAIIIILSFISHQESVSKEQVTRNKTFASGFSHDLRNLFQYLDWMVASEYNYTSILQVVEVLKKKSVRIERQREALEDLLNTTEVVKGYLKESLKECQIFYDLVQKEYIDPKDMQEVDISEFIKETRFFVPSSFQKKVKIRVRKAVKVVVNPTILRSTLLNLIKNGFKHGGSKNVTVGWDYKKNSLYIQDYGKGIDPEKEPYIFDLYYTTGGSGVGLPFIKTMLEKINSSIYFETSPKGTTFYIDLPVVNETKQKDDKLKFT